MSSISLCCQAIDRQVFHPGTAAATGLSEWFLPRKVYDLARRHIPARLLRAAEPNPSEERYKEWRVERRIKGIGMTWDRSADSWLGIGNLTGGERSAAIARLLARKRLRPVRVQGMDQAFYVRSADMGTLEAVLSSRPPRARAALIAPLDNLLWDRRLIGELFGFGLPLGGLQARP